MKLNIGEKDYMGPMAYNSQLADFISINGKLASKELPLELDKNEKIWCKDISILHIPSNKVSAYSCYCNFSTKQITIFNGFFQEPIEEDLSNIKWIYDSKKTKIGKFSDKKPRN